MKKYLCAIEPNVNSETFYYFDTDTIESNFKRYKILNNWFYFFINPPVDPVVIWRFENNAFDLHPGTNRYIGMSLRNDGSKIYAYLITESIKKMPKEIEILELVDKYNDFTVKDRIRYNRSNKPTKEMLYWAIDDTRDDSWRTRIYDDVEVYIRENFKSKWGLKYKDEMYYLGNTNAEVAKVIDANEFDSLSGAISFLFNYAAKQENIVIEPA